MLQLRRIAGSALLVGLVGLSGCKALDKVLSLDFVDLADSRIENLERLHTPSGSHRYAVQFVGDFEHSFNRSGRTVGGLRIGKPEAGDPGANPLKPLADPSEKCFELLTELLEFDAEDDERLASLQIAWCARVIAGDPSHQCRELAARALGAHGRRVGFEGPLLLAREQPRADANETAQLLTALIASWRAQREGRAGPGAFARDLEALAQTTFDLEGSRRVLPALAGLLSGSRPGEPGHAELSGLLHVFQRRTIELALASALSDRPRSGRRERSAPASRVRAAAVSASVEAGGAAMLARFVASTLRAERRRGPDRDAIVVVEILSLVQRYGFPVSLEGFDPAQFADLREGWLGVLVGLAVEDPESHVRVKAMQALASVSEGPRSLREEDWEEWHYARSARLREEAGLPRALDAVEASEDPGS